MYWIYILFPGNIIIKYGQVRFIIKSANYYESYSPFFDLFFCAKYLRGGEDGPGRGHLCHTDTFLFFFFLEGYYHLTDKSDFTLDQLLTVDW